jgi:iron(III) transport system substrate-binding protein
MKRISALSLSVLTAAVLGLSACSDNGSSESQKTAATSEPAKQVVIYTNADEEAQQAMKNALDNNGFKGAYLMQSFGTSELGGKIAAEGKNIEADLITISTYYLDSFQKQNKMFQDLKFKVDTLNPTPSYYAPILGNTGALFINTEVLKSSGLATPKAIADLAKPEYAGHISVPDIMGSSTSWLMTQAVLTAEGEEQGAKTIATIEKNAGAHLEKSGSAPLKKLRAGEVAVGFGLRHQAVADKAKGLPIDYIDPVEGNFQLQEAVAVVDKGDKTNPNAQKMAETIIKHGRTELLKYYPVALYKGETVSAENKPANPKLYKEPLTVELLQAHQKLVKGQNK